MVSRCEKAFAFTELWTSYISSAEKLNGRKKVENLDWE